MPRPGLGGADQLFAALDGQIITVREERWELRIFGIYLSGERAWLQFHLSGPEEIDGMTAVEWREAEAALRRIRGGLERRPAGSLTLVC